MATKATKRATAEQATADLPGPDAVGLEEAGRVLDLPVNILTLHLARGDLPSSVSDGRIVILRADLATFQASLARQRAAQRELADITEELISVHGL